MKFPALFRCILLLGLFFIGIGQIPQATAQAGKNKKSNTAKKQVSDEEEEDVEPEDGKMPEGFAQDEKINYLEMQCDVTEQVIDKGKAESEAVPFVLFRVYDENNKLRKPLFTTEKGKCKLRLGFNHEYKIYISRKGYVQKVIKVNTHLPKDLNTAYIFPADISFYKDFPDVDASLFKNPVATISYSEKTKQFEYDDLFMKKMQPELKKFSAVYMKKLKTIK